MLRVSGTCVQWIRVRFTVAAYTRGRVTFVVSSYVAAAWPIMPFIYYKDYDVEAKIFTSCSFPLLAYWCKLIEGRVCWCFAAIIDTWVQSRYIRKYCTITVADWKYTLKLSKTFTKRLVSVLSAISKLIPAVKKRPHPRQISRNLKTLLKHRIDVILKTCIAFKLFRNTESIILNLKHQFHLRFYVKAMYKSNHTIFPSESRSRSPDYQFERNKKKSRTDVKKYYPLKFRLHKANKNREPIVISITAKKAISSSLYGLTQ